MWCTTVVTDPCREVKGKRKMLPVKKATPGRGGAGRVMVLLYVGRRALLLSCVPRLLRVPT